MNGIAGENSTSTASGRTSRTEELNGNAVDYYLEDFFGLARLAEDKYTNLSEDSNSYTGIPLEEGQVSLSVRCGQEIRRSCSKGTH